MKSNKIITALIVILTVMSLMSCSIKEQSSNSPIDLFDMKQARDISKGYLENISIGNVEIANGFCAPELINSNKEITTGVSEITSYSLDSIIEGNDFAYFLFNVIRSSSLEPKSDLESYTIKVQKNDNIYKITEVKALSQKELYVKGNGLRVIGDEGGKSNLIVTLNNIPKDTYLRENKLMLYKHKVPSESFGKVALSFSGKKIAITTTDNKDSYVCIAVIDETLMTLAPNLESGADAANPSGIDMLQEALEKSIAKNIVSVDLFKESEVSKFIFSKEDELLSVQFKNKFNADRINLYNTADGSILETKLNDVFPEDKYSINAGSFEDDQYKFKVSVLDNVSEFNNELIGEFKIDLSTLEIKKL